MLFQSSRHPFHSKLNYHAFFISVIQMLFISSLAESARTAEFCLGFVSIISSEFLSPPGDKVTLNLEMSGIMWFLIDVLNFTGRK